MCRENIPPECKFRRQSLLFSLREDYSPALALEHIIQGLLFILYNPNFSDPLEEHISLLYQTNPNKFIRNVKAPLRGKTIDGVSYTRLIP